MLPNYKIRFYHPWSIQEDTWIYTNTWRCVDNEHCCNSYSLQENLRRYFSINFTKKNFEGLVSIYKINDSQDTIEVLKNKDIINKLNNNGIFDNHFYNCLINRFLIFFLSEKYDSNHVILSEKVFIKVQNTKFNYGPIYKNGNYIINKRFIVKECINNLGRIYKLEIVFRIVHISGNKYYADKEKIILIKNICDEFNIEYEDIPNGIEIFIITNLTYIKDKKYKGEIFISKYKDNFTLTKVGKYVLYT